MRALSEDPSVALSAMCAPASHDEPVDRPLKSSIYGIFSGDFCKVTNNSQISGARPAVYPEKAQDWGEKCAFPSANLFTSQLMASSVSRILMIDRAIRVPLIHNVRPVPSV